MRHPFLPSEKDFLLQLQGVLSASSLQLSAPSRMASAGENLLVQDHVTSWASWGSLRPITDQSRNIKAQPSWPHLE